MLLLLAPLMLPGVASANCVSGVPGSLSASTVNVIPVTVSASSASSNAQLMLTFPASAYTAYLASNLQNIYVFNGLGSYPVNAFIVGNVLNFQQTTSMNTAANVIIYINDVSANDMATSSDTNYCIGVGATSTNFFANANAHIYEAPQLSTNYGQYSAAWNKCGGVFAFCDIWYGTSLNTSKWILNAGSVAISNGLTIGPGQGESAINTIGTYNPTLYYTISSAYDTVHEGVRPLMGGFGERGTGGSACSFAGSDSANYVLTNCAYPTTPLGAGSITNYNLFEIWVSGTTSYGTMNLGALVSNGAGTAATNPAYLFLYNNPVAGTMHVQWTAIATQAPNNNAQPGTTFGSIQASGGSSGVLTLTIASNPVDYGLTDLLTATSNTPANTVKLQYCTGSSPCSSFTTLATSTGTVTNSICGATPSIANCRAAGTYNIIANDVTAHQTASAILTINTVPQPLAWTAQCTYPSMTWGTTPNPCTTSTSVTTLGNQATATLWLNGVSIGTANTAISTTLNTNTLGAMTYVFNSPATANYTANSITYNTIIYVQASLLNMTPGTSTLGTKTLTPGISPFIWNTYYPIGFATSSPSNLITYTLTQGSTALQSNVLNLGYMPSANTATGNYVFMISEFQGANTVSMIVAANALNMTDMNGQLTFNSLCTPSIQYLPNCAVFPFASNVFTVKPQHWSINSDVLQNTHSNVSNVDQWSNANLTFNTVITLTYPSPFGSFTLNSLNNQKVQNTITQTQAFQYVANATAPASPNNRKLFNVTTYDQQFLTLPVDSVTSASYGWIVNNYTGYTSFAFLTYNTNTVWASMNNYQNPPICLNNIEITSQASGHATVYNYYLPYCQPYGSSRSFYAYLVNTNATVTQFVILSGGGYGGYNDTMLVLTGPSSSSLTQVQSYKIQPNGVPFQLTLQSNQQYEFQIINTQNQTRYTSAFNLWGSSVQINLPVIIPANSITLLNATANCTSAFNGTLNRSVVTCTGSDPHNFATSWNILISNVTTSLNTTMPLAQQWYNATSSFVYSYTLNRLTTEYNFKVIACSATYCQILTSRHFNRQAYQPFGPAGAWIGIALFMFSIGWGQKTKGLTVVFGLLAMLVGIYISSYNMPFEGYIGLVVVGAALFWFFETGGFDRPG